jgi:hypothetical protein
MKESSDSQISVSHSLHRLTPSSQTLSTEEDQTIGNPADSELVTTVSMLELELL